MKPNDYIIIIEDESPAQRIARTGEKHSKRNHPQRQHKVAFVDVVETVNGENVRLKNDKTAEFDNQGVETAASRSQRAARGEPTRRALIAPQNVFALPKGMQATIDWVSLDSQTLNALELYDRGVRQSRG